MQEQKLANLMLTAIWRSYFLRVMELDCDMWESEVR